MRPGIIVDESQVPAYTLPELLRDANGHLIDSAQAWQNHRTTLIDLFANHIYGETPMELPTVEVVDHSVERGVLDGLAIRKQTRLRFSRENQAIEVDLLMYLPMKTQAPPGVFLGLNFYGNQAVHSDPGIALVQGWVRNNPDFGITDHRGTESSRGVQSSRWPIEQIVEGGYAVATACYTEFDPDYDDGFQNGVHALYPPSTPGERSPDAWGSIGVWAWGLSRLLDYVIQDQDIDAHRVIAIGLSRLGKTALWAAAQDTRFAAVISNNSGCAGAALSRRTFGETVAVANEVVPYWYCPRFKNYVRNEAGLPVDQHQLLALIAPRPLYVASASEDLWADPYGEYLSAFHAGEVYHLFGYKGLDSSELPPVNHPITGRISYHLRQGPHEITAYDWQQYIVFADQQVTGPSAKEK